MLGDSSFWGNVGVGAVVLAALTALIAYLLERLRQRAVRTQRQRSLASALLGEVTSLLELAISRYQPIVRATHVRFQRGELVVLPPMYSGNDFFGVYKSSIDDLGLLPHPLPRDIVGFYTMALAVQEGLRTLVMPEWNAAADTPARKKFVQALNVLLEQTRRVGTALVTQLQVYLDS